MRPFPLIARLLTVLALVASTTLVTSFAAADPADPAEPRAWPGGSGVPVATGLTLPWGVAQLPDESVLMTTRAGELLHATPTGTRTVTSIPDVRATGEGGLLGLVVDPVDPRVVFAYRTTTRGNEVVRFDYDGTRVTNLTTIVGGIPASESHNGGRLAFGPDGYLYVSTGDGGVRNRAQDPGSLGGKILRVDRSGRAAAGNPFGSRVWSLGHRNVQGMAWDSMGRMWASEFGATDWDELNLIEPGRNYGWPIVEGMGHDARFDNPVHVWTPAEMSPSGLAIVNDMIFIGALRGQSVWTVPAKGGTPRRWLQGELGRVRTVVGASDGRLLIATSNGGGQDQVRLVGMDRFATPISRAYAQLGGSGGRLGASVTGEYCGLARSGCFQQLRNGWLYWTAETGVHPVLGAIGDRWQDLGWELGRPGYPTTGESCALRDSGCVQSFTGASIFWSPASGAWETWGAIGATHQELGAEGGQLRYPTGPEFCTIRDRGCLQRFQGGNIYYSPGNGTHAVWGAIFDAWSDQRWEAGSLGYPTSREFCTLKDRGCFQRYEGGSIYWSPGTGAHPVRGAIRDIWGGTGWENGRYGYPIGSESCRPGECTQRFQGGEIIVRW